MNKRILRYAEPEVVFRTGSFYYPITVSRNYFFVICPRKEAKVVFLRGVFFICTLTCLENYFFVIQIKEYCATRSPKSFSERVFSFYAMYINQLSFCCERSGPTQGVS